MAGQSTTGSAPQAAYAPAGPSPYGHGTNDLGVLALGAGLGGGGLLAWNYWQQQQAKGKDTTAPVPPGADVPGPQEAEQGVNQVNRKPNSGIPQPAWEVPPGLRTPEWTPGADPWADVARPPDPWRGGYVGDRQAGPVDRSELTSDLSKRLNAEIQDLRNPRIDPDGAIQAQARKRGITPRKPGGAS